MSSISSQSYDDWPAKLIVFGVRSCEITLGERKSYEYNAEIQAHEKALRGAKLVERLNGMAVAVRAVSCPVVTVLPVEAA